MIQSQPPKISHFVLLGLGFLSLLGGIFVAGQLVSVQKSRAQEVDSMNGTPIQEKPEGGTPPGSANQTNQGSAQPGESTETLSPIEGENQDATAEDSGETPTDQAIGSSPDEQAPTFDSSIEYRYEPVGKRDPFRPFRDSKIGIGQIRSTNRNLEPLELFDIRSLEVVAIVWGNEKPKVLIQDPQKQVHSAIKGQRIGKNEGFIAEIREGEIVVVELFDLNGKVVKESVVIPIRK